MPSSVRQLKYSLKDTHPVAAPNGNDGVRMDGVLYIMYIPYIQALRLQNIRLCIPYNIFHYTLYGLEHGDYTVLCVFRAREGIE